MKHIFSFFLTLMLASTAFAAEKAPEANAPLNPYEQIMVGKVWVTTDAVDQKGASVPATDEKVAAFFGKAEYFPDHTFKITFFGWQTEDAWPLEHIGGTGKPEKLTVQDGSARLALRER